MSALLALREVSVDLGGRRVLDSISMSVNRGEVVALLGPNGAGKTTLLRAALGLASTRGAVELGGDDVRRSTARQRALRAAYLPQRPDAIWPIKVEALVALGRYAHGAAPDKPCARDQAAVDRAIGACALQNLRERRMDEISGGEKARAHLARALAQDAPLLLLDEPTAGLDPAQAMGVVDILRGHTVSSGGVLFSTHDIALAANAAHRVLLLQAGRVVAEGAPEAALSAEALEAAYGKRLRLERMGESFALTFRR